VEQTLQSAVRAAREALGDAGALIAPIAGHEPRFELFHAANSICSQKVRCVLAHHQQPYVSRTVDIFVGQNYLPSYVRLRMIGCDRLGGNLVSHHSGSTSASAGGCDGAVVPTLVDWEATQVMVDSKRICIYLDDQAADASKLRPAHLAGAVDEELALVDNLPNYQMLMGRPAAATDGASTNDSLRANFSRKKVALCDRYLTENADDETLVRAYAAKRAKELSAANELFSPEAMQAAYSKAEVAVQGLERKLKRFGGAWLFPEMLTMADLFWGIELLRMENVGAATFWNGGRLPEVERFLAAIEALPAIRASIINWPGATF